MPFHNRIRGRTRHVALCAAAYASCVVLSGSRTDPQFMSYDAVAHRVDLTITAALDRSNSGYNFNGASYGAHRITVPLGWSVTIDFVNRDVFPHSIAVIREPRFLPLRIAKPVFRGAASRAPEVGLPAGGRQSDIAFVASLPGAYLIACGVPGHAASGSYISLTVSYVDTVPTYEMNQRPIAPGRIGRRWPKTSRQAAMTAPEWVMK